MTHMPLITPTKIVVGDALVYSDVHVRPERYDDCGRVLEAIETERVRCGAKTLVNLGDTFNTRGLVPTRCLDLLYRHYKRWSDAGVEQVILIGNHDQEDRAGEMHPFRVFGELPGVKVVDRPTYFPALGALRNAYFFPYMAEVREMDVEVARRLGARMLFVHWGIRGAWRNNANTDTDGVPPEMLTGFDAVFSGHYHRHQSFANVVYVGSPMEQDFGEAGESKGVLLLDGNLPGTWMRIPLNAGTRRHFVLEVAVDDAGKLSVDPNAMRALVKGMVPRRREGIARGDVLRFDLSGPPAAMATVTTARLEELVAVSEPDDALPPGSGLLEGVTLLIDRSASGATSTSRLGIEATDVHSTERLLEKYVAHMDPALDHAELLRIGKELLA